MPNLITLSQGNGQVVGRCNQHCYNAVDPNRSCICGGINNGVGLARAKANLGQVLAHIATRPSDLPPVTIKLHAAGRQLDPHTQLKLQALAHGQAFMEDLCDPTVVVIKKPNKHP